MGFFENALGAIPIVGPAIQNTLAQNNQRQADYDSRLQSDRQMDFQKEMSNTAHQREVEDLKLAGLNPNLSAGGNGSSTPSGAASSSSAAPQISMPSILSYANDLKDIEVKDQSMKINAANSAAQIAKGLTDQELSKAKTILAKKGMLRANLEGEASDIMMKGIKWLKQQINTPSLKNLQTQPKTEQRLP